MVLKDIKVSLVQLETGTHLLGGILEVCLFLGAELHETWDARGVSACASGREWDD